MFLRSAVNRIGIIGTVDEVISKKQNGLRDFANFTAARCRGEKTQ